MTYGTDAYSTIGFQSGVPSNVNGIVGGYAFFSANGSGVDFATISGSTVRQYTGYTNTDLGTMAAASGSLNLSPTVVQSSVALSKTCNSLRLIGSTGVNMTGAGAHA